MNQSDSEFPTDDVLSRIYCASPYWLCLRAGHIPYGAVLYSPVVCERVCYPDCESSLL